MWSWVMPDRQFWSYIVIGIMFLLIIILWIYSTIHTEIVIVDHIEWRRTIIIEEKKDHLVVGADGEIHWETTWEKIAKYISTGGRDDPLIWPKYKKPNSDQRESRKTVFYVFVRKNNNKMIYYKANDIEEWLTFLPGQKCNARLYAFDSIWSLNHIEAELETWNNEVL